MGEGSVDGCHGEGISLHQSKEDPSLPRLGKSTSGLAIMPPGEVFSHGAGNFHAMKSVTEITTYHIE